MPGSMFITATELSSLPVSGTPWSRVAAVAAEDAGTPNLGNLDSIVQTKVLVQALAWARNGTGVGQAAIKSKILAVVGTESTSTKPLTFHRQIATWIAAADMIDLNDAGFDAWVRTLPDKVIAGQDNWNTLRKCSRTSGNNWGAYARPSLLAVALWLKKRGLTASNGQSADSLITEVTNYFKRWLGDTSVPNTFVITSDYKSGWAVGSYPSSQGVINPVSSNSELNGANVEDASRGSSAPPLTGAGASYSMEALDGALMTAILLHHAGKTDVWSYGNSALKRNGQEIGSSLFTSSNHIYRHEPYVLNWVYGINVGTPTIDSYGGRAVPFCTDWLCQGQYLKTAITGGTGGDTGGGTTPTPVVIPPTVSFTLSRVNQTVTVNASASTAGSSPITGHEINWGDGSAVQTVLKPVDTASHTYNPASATTYTVRVTAYASDGGRTTGQPQTVLVPSADGAPVAVLSVTPRSGTAPLTVAYDFAGSFDPDGDTPLVYSIDFGDGTVVNPASASGTHIYTDSTSTDGYTVVGKVTAGALASTPVVTTVTVSPAASAAITGTLYMALNGQLVPVNPTEVLRLATGASVPSGTLPGTLVVRT